MSKKELIFSLLLLSGSMQTGEKPQSTMVPTQKKSPYIEQIKKIAAGENAVYGLADLLKTAYENGDAQEFNKTVVNFLKFGSPSVQKKLSSFMIQFHNFPDTLFKWDSEKVRGKLSPLGNRQFTLTAQQKLDLTHFSELSQQIFTECPDSEYVRVISFENARKSNNLATELNKLINDYHKEAEHTKNILDILKEKLQEAYENGDAEEFNNTIISMLHSSKSPAVSYSPVISYSTVVAELKNFIGSIKGKAESIFPNSFDNVQNLRLLERNAQKVIEVTRPKSALKPSKAPVVPEVPQEKLPVKVESEKELSTYESQIIDIIAQAFKDNPANPVMAQTDIQDNLYDLIKEAYDTQKSADFNKSFLSLLSSSEDTVFKALKVFMRQLEVFDIWTDLPVEKIDRKIQVKKGDPSLTGQQRDIIRQFGVLKVNANNIIDKRSPASVEDSSQEKANQLKDFLQKWFDPTKISQDRRDIDALKAFDPGEYLTSLTSRNKMQLPEFDAIMKRVNPEMIGSPIFDAMKVVARIYSNKNAFVATDIDGMNLLKGLCAKIGGTFMIDDPELYQSIVDRVMNALMPAYTIADESNVISDKGNQKTAEAFLNSRIKVLDTFVTEMRNNIPPKSRLSKIGKWFNLVARGRQSMLQWRVKRLKKRLVNNNTNEARYEEITQLINATKKQMTISEMRESVLAWIGDILRNATLEKVAGQPEKLFTILKSYGCTQMDVVQYIITTSDIGQSPEFVQALHAMASADISLSKDFTFDPDKFVDTTVVKSILPSDTKKTPSVKDVSVKPAKTDPKGVNSDPKELIQTRGGTSGRDLTQQDEKKKRERQEAELKAQKEHDAALRETGSRSEVPQEGK